MKKILLILVIATLCTVGSTFGSWVFYGETTKDLSADEGITVASPNLYEISYKGFNDSSNMPSFVFGKDSIEIDGFKNTVVKSVEMGSETLTENVDYTIRNDQLNIPVLNDDITITAIQPITDNLFVSTSKYYRTETKFGDFEIYNTGDDYDGNNGNFKYSSAMGLQVTSDNPVAVMKVDSTTPSKITNSFTASLVIKSDAGKFNQEDHKFPTTVIGIKDKNPNKEGYLLWVGYYYDHLHVYAYRSTNWDGNNKGTAYTAVNLKLDNYTFLGKVISVHVVATRNGEGIVYIHDGTKHITKTFDTDNVTFDYNQVCLGDLYAGRGLKLDGYIYDARLYNRALSSEEIAKNVAYAKEAWPLGK